MQPESSRKSIILYPTLNSDAIEQIVVLRGPITGELMAEVVLRPVHLIELEQLLIARGGPQVFHRRAELAHRLTFGPIG